MNGYLSDQNTQAQQTNDKGKRQKLSVNFGEDSRAQVKIIVIYTERWKNLE